MTALASQPKALYEHVDNVEYYVGLFAERVEKSGPLLELISSMVAMDAISHALTNPLLPEHVWGNAKNKRLAFTDEGIKTIEGTKRVLDFLYRNSRGPVSGFVGMTRPEWKRR